MLREYTNTVCRWCYGSYDKCACGKWKLPLYKSYRSAHRWGYKPYYHRKISDEHTKREFFSLRKAILGCWIGCFKWSDIRRGGVDCTITRPDSKRQWQAGLSWIKVWNSPGKASNGELDFLQSSERLVSSSSIWNTSSLQTEVLKPFSLYLCWSWKVLLQTNDTAQQFKEFYSEHRKSAKLPWYQNI